MNHAFDTDKDYRAFASLLYEQWRLRTDATEDFEEWKVAEIRRLRDALREIAKLPLGHHDAKRIAKSVLA